MHSAYMNMMYTLLYVNLTILILKLPNKGKNKNQVQYVIFVVVVMAFSYVTWTGWNIHNLQSRNVWNQIIFSSNQSSSGMWNAFLKFMCSWTLVIHSSISRIPLILSKNFQCISNLAEYRVKVMNFSLFQIKKYM
jgi:hypothetical protein